MADIRASSQTVASSIGGGGGGGDLSSSISKSEAAQNVLMAITLQIRARTEELASGRSPLVLSERVIHLIEKTRKSYIRGEQNVVSSSSSPTSRQDVVVPENDTTTTAEFLRDSSNTNAGEQSASRSASQNIVVIKKLIHPNVSKQLFDELRKISFLVVLGKVRASNFAEQAKEEEEQAKKAALQRRRTQDQILGGMSSSSAGAAGGGGGDNAGGHSSSSASSGKSLSFASFPNLVNVAFFGCHVRRLDGLARIAKFTCANTEIPSTASMPLLGVFAALRHIEFDLELGMVSPIVEQLSSFCFSLRSVSITINETVNSALHHHHHHHSSGGGGYSSSGGGDRHGAYISHSTTAVTMNRRLFADVWRPKGAQIKLLGASQKKANASASSPSNNTNAPSSPTNNITNTPHSPTTPGVLQRGGSPNFGDHHDDQHGGGGGFWEALSHVKIRGDLCRRRGEGQKSGSSSMSGMQMAVLMLDDSWRGLRHVTSLSLRGLRFSSFMELVALSGLVHLRELDLGDNNISSLAGAHESLPKNHLKTLHLDANRISGGLAEISHLPGITALDLSVNNISQWTELTPLSGGGGGSGENNNNDNNNKNNNTSSLISLDVRANSLDARAPHERDSVINAEDVVSVILRVIGNSEKIEVVNGFPVTNTLRTAADTQRIRKNVDAILAQERVTTEAMIRSGAMNINALGGEGVEGSGGSLRASAVSIHNRGEDNNDDDDDDNESLMLSPGRGRAPYVPASSTAGGGGGKKRKRLVVKGVPTRIVQVSGNTSSTKRNMAALTSAEGDGGAHASNVGNTTGAGGQPQISQTGLDYLRQRFGDQYLLYLPEAQLPAYIDPNDPNPQNRILSYEQQKHEIGVAGLVGDKLSGGNKDGEGGEKEKNSSSGASSGVAQLKRQGIITPVQPVLDQFLSEIKRHDWYPTTTITPTSSSSNAKAQQQQQHQNRQKVFPLGCEMMMSTITYENACYWEVDKFPPARQTSSQPYAVHPDCREIVLVNGSDKNNKTNDTHMRFARKVLFRVVETRVGFARHVRLEERNLSALPVAYFQNSSKRLAELAGPQSGIIREKPPKLSALGVLQQGLSQEHLENIPSFSGRYPIFQCVLPSDEHTQPVQVNSKFLSVSKARTGVIPQEATSPSFAGSNMSSANLSPEKRYSNGISSASESKSGGGGFFGGNKVTEIGMDEMAELSRHRIFDTDCTQLLAGFVVPVRIAAEFKRRLVHQLKTAAAKLSIQGVFREWPFVIRGEGSGEQRDASVPIEPTGKYLHDRILQCSPEMESLARQRINNDVGASDQELSLRLRRFVFEKQRKFSTEAIPEFDFLAYFGALSPESVMWSPAAERCLIVGCAGSSMFVAENIDTLNNETGQTTAQSPEEHFKTPRRYDLVNLRAVVCSFDLSTIRLVFNHSNPRSRDLQLLSREPKISFQLLSTLVRLRFLPDTPAIVGPWTDLPKIITSIQDGTSGGGISSSSPKTSSSGGGNEGSSSPTSSSASTATQAQVYFRPTNIGRFTSAPFVFSAQVFFKCTETPESGRAMVINSSVYPMRCIHAIIGGWCCARLVITSKHMRLAEVREMVTVDVEHLFSRKKKQLEDPLSVDVQQPSSLLRFELAPAQVFPLMFNLVFNCPSAPSKEANWLLCAPHPATLFAIRRELRNVQPIVVVSEIDMDLVDELPGFPPPADKLPTTSSSTTNSSFATTAQQQGGVSERYSAVNTSPNPTQTRKQHQSPMADRQSVTMSSFSNNSGGSPNNMNASIARSERSTGSGMTRYTSA